MVSLSSLQTKQFSWEWDNCPIEQVSQFYYLGILFQTYVSCRTHKGVLCCLQLVPQRLFSIFPPLGPSLFLQLFKFLRLKYYQSFNRGQPELIVLSISPWRLLFGIWMEFSIMLPLWVSNQNWILAQWNAKLGSWLSTLLKSFAFYASLWLSLICVMFSSADKSWILTLYFPGFVIYWPSGHWSFPW